MRFASDFFASKSCRIHPVKNVDRINEQAYRLHIVRLVPMSPPVLRSLRRSLHEVDHEEVLVTQKATLDRQTETKGFRQSFQSRCFIRQVNSRAPEDLYAQGGRNPLHQRRWAWSTNR